MWKLFFFQEAWLGATFKFSAERLLDLSSAGHEDDPDLLEASSESVLEETEDEGAGSDFFLASDEDGPPCKKQRSQPSRPRQSEPYTLLGKQVCRQAFSILLGVGNSTLAKIRAGTPALTNKRRPPLAKHPMFGFAIRGCESHWQHIVMFLWHIYHSEAEVLPTNYKLVGEKGLTQESPFPEDQTDLDADAVARAVNGFSRTLHTFTTDVDVNLIGPGTFKGAVRSLPHGSRTELFWHYCAYCEMRDIEAASYSTFLRVANPILKPGVRDGHLRFRKTNEHGQCDQCFALRKAVSLAKTERERSNARKDHHRHILAQWLDRQIYWSFRSLSQAFFSSVLHSGVRSLELVFSGLAIFKIRILI